MSKRFCQSCGMPLKQDPNYTAGDAEVIYCSYCYADGAFMQPDFTARQMQDWCVEKMVEQGTSRWLAWLLTRGIPRLERWKGRNHSPA